ncbi:MAG: OmpA family protein [Nitrospirae bacterium]|nr:OmpA family protein [Nitrospirota bacterium]
MRNIIIGLSILFYILSGIITFKALVIPAGRANVPANKTRVLAVLGDGAFSSGQFIIDERLITAVKNTVSEISASPDYRVIIEGHTDNRPIRSSAVMRYSDNMELSFLRAKIVASILVKYDIPVERISVIGYGDARPIASNDTAEGRVKNRRVEIKLIPKDKGF